MPFRGFGKPTAANTPKRRGSASRAAEAVAVGLLRDRTGGPAASDTPRTSPNGQARVGRATPCRALRLSAEIVALESRGKQSSVCALRCVGTAATEDGRAARFREPGWGEMVIAGRCTSRMTVADPAIVRRPGIVWRMARYAQGR